MLVLTRKSNQSIMIGDDIEVSVLAIMGEKVRIGIEAPRSIPVFRKEVYLEIQQDQPQEENKKAVNDIINPRKLSNGIYNLLVRGWAGWAKGNPSIFQPWIELSAIPVEAFATQATIIIAP